MFSPIILPVCILYTILWDEFALIDLCYFMNYYPYYIWYTKLVYTPNILIFLLVEWCYFQGHDSDGTPEGHPVTISADQICEENIQLFIKYVLYFLPSSLVSCCTPYQYHLHVQLWVSACWFQLVVVDIFDKLWMPPSAKWIFGIIVIPKACIELLLANTYESICLHNFFLHNIYHFIWL